MIFWINNDAFRSSGLLSFVQARYDEGGVTPPLDMEIVRQIFEKFGKFHMLSKICIFFGAFGNF